MELTLNEKRCLESFTRSGYFAGEYDKDRYPGLNLGDWIGFTEKGWYAIKTILGD